MPSFLQTSFSFIIFWDREKKEKRKGWEGEGWDGIDSGQRWRWVEVVFVVLI